MLVSSQLESAYIGQPSKRLRCETEAYPQSINYWTNGRGEMITAGTHVPTNYHTIIDWIFGNLPGNSPRSHFPLCEFDRRQKKNSAPISPGSCGVACRACAGGLSGHWLCLRQAAVWGSLGLCWPCLRDAAAVSLRRPEVPLTARPREGTVGEAGPPLGDRIITAAPGSTDAAPPLIQLADVFSIICHSKVAI